MVRTIAINGEDSTPISDRSIVTRMQTKKLTALGNLLTPELIQQTYDLMRPFAPQLNVKNCKASYDLEYGPHHRHLLDLYTPVTGASHALVIYVHGGGFSAGDKGGKESPFFSNIGIWAVSHGFSAACMTYRLAPGARWPSGAEDIALAVRYLLQQSLGMRDSVKIFLVGQSAGAVHLADYLVGRGGPVTQNISGAALISGLYDFSRHNRMYFEDDYFGSNPLNFSKHSTLDSLVSLSMPLFFSVSEHDPVNFQRQAMHIVGRFFEVKKHWPEMHYLTGHNHISPTLQIGSDADSVGPLLIQFFHDTLQQEDACDVDF